MSKNKCAVSLYRKLLVEEIFSWRMKCVTQQLKCHANIIELVWHKKGWCMYSCQKGTLPSYYLTLSFLIWNIVGMVEFDGEEMLISLGGVWLEFSMVVFDKPFSSITAHSYSMSHLADLLFSAAGLLFTPPRQQVFMLQLEHLEFCSNEWVIWLISDIVDHFLWKKIFTSCWEGMMWVSPILFYATNLNEKWKNWKNDIFCMIRGEQKGRLESMQPNSFFAFELYTF